MSRNVPMDQPLSDEDRLYLQQRGALGDSIIARLDQNYPPDAEDSEPDDDAEEDVPPYSTWRKADLVSEIGARNKAQALDPPLSDKGNVPELAARLEQNDAELAEAREQA